MYIVQPNTANYYLLAPEMLTRKWRKKYREFNEASKIKFRDWWSSSILSEPKK